MKQRKKLPYLALFIDDWLASAKVRKCTETTRGVYIDLLCILHKEPRRGSYALHDQELKPNTTRSKTQLALAKTAETQRLPYFAEFLVKRTGSAKSVIVKALQELYHHGIIVVEDDALIQPRMYRDSGFYLHSDVDENGEPLTENGELKNAVVTTGDAEDDLIRNRVEKNEEKNNKKITKKPRVRASREYAHVHNGNGNNNNNIINNIHNVNSEEEKEEKYNNVNDVNCKNGDFEKTAQNNPEGENSVFKPAEGSKRGDVDNCSGNDLKQAQRARNGVVVPTFGEFWDAYDLKVGKKAAESLWNRLSRADKLAVMAYIPLYIQAVPNKMYRRRPPTFFRQRTWEDEIVNHPQRPSTCSGTVAHNAGKDKYKHKW